MQPMSINKMMNSMVPITRFNKGEANRIFDEVSMSGTKIVIKNNKPTCVLMSPAKYEALMEMLYDYMMKEEADSRLASGDDSSGISEDEIMKEFGISEEDLDIIDVEIE